MSNELLGHLIWMCKHMPWRLDNPYKWNRWLGFIQGCLVAHGMATIKEMKTANKSSLAAGLLLCGSTLELEANYRGAHGIKIKFKRVKDEEM